MNDILEQIVDNYDNNCSKYTKDNNIDIIENSLPTKVSYMLLIIKSINRLFNTKAINNKSFSFFSFCFRLGNFCKRTLLIGSRFDQIRRDNDSEG